MRLNIEVDGKSTKLPWQQADAERYLRDEAARCLRERWRVTDEFGREYEAVVSVTLVPGPMQKED